MARRPALIKKTQKKVRVSKSETYLVNLKYLGEEPSFKGPLSQSDYLMALNWYNYMCETKDAREYIETYLKNNNRADDLKKFKRVSDTWVPTTAAWICRLLNKGYEIPSSNEEFLSKELKFCLSKSVKEEPKQETNTPVVSIQDRMRERQHEIIGQIEEMIDTGEDFSLYDWLKSNEIPASYCPLIIRKYTPWLLEMIEAHEKKDPQLVEGYSYLTKKELQKKIEFFNKLVEDAEKYGSVTKKTRTPRKPRAVSVEKKLKHLKYQKEDNTLKIASINPEKILGAQELWTFNTKYKVVTVFRAIDRGGLQINRSSITGFDEKASESKGCGRKPEIVLDKLQNGGKIILKKLMSELKSDKPLQVRINENTILMKVM